MNELRYYHPAEELRTIGRRLENGPFEELEKHLGIGEILIALFMHPWEWMAREVPTASNFRDLVCYKDCEFYALSKVAAEIGFKRKPVPTEFAACTPAQLAQVDPWANESKANLHWLSRRSGCAEDKCLLALREAGGDLQQALRRLVPSGNWRKFPDWYYSGPYKTVGDPDRDLPVRESNELSQYEIDNETDRKIDGERLIAPFNDANSLSDISGCILSPTGHPIFCDLEMAAWGHIQANMAEAADRIREKLRRSKNKVRNEFFENAVRLIEIAKDMYFDHRYPEGQACLFEAHRLLQEGNKPKRK